MSKQENPELWRELAERASKEQNPEKLMELTKQINQLLDKKHDPRNKKPLSDPIA